MAASDQRMRVRTTDSRLTQGICPAPRPDVANRAPAGPLSCPAVSMRDEDLSPPCLAMAREDRRGRRWRGTIGTGSGASWPDRCATRRASRRAQVPGPGRQGPRSVRVRLRRAYPASRRRGGSCRWRNARWPRRPEGRRCGTGHPKRDQHARRIGRTDVAPGGRLAAGRRRRKVERALAVPVEPPFRRAGGRQGIGIGGEHHPPEAARLR